MTVSSNDTPDIPDWGRYMSPAELEREAMDYELNAAYDRYDGWGDPDYCGDDADNGSESVPYVAPTPPVRVDDSEIPF
jgi:hypothetical protein